MQVGVIFLPQSCNAGVSKIASEGVVHGFVLCDGVQNFGPGLCFGLHPEGLLTWRFDSERESLIPGVM